MNDKKMAAHTPPLGWNSWANAESATALGESATASAVNSVALGAGSVANREDSVSVGSAGNERQITNVAAGTEATDAVNVEQLETATQYNRYFAATGGVDSDNAAFVDGELDVVQPSRVATGADRIVEHRGRGGQVADDDAQRVRRPVARHGLRPACLTRLRVVRLNGHVGGLHVLLRDAGRGDRVDHRPGPLVRLRDRAGHVRSDHLGAQLGVQDVRRAAHLAGPDDGHRTVGRRTGAAGDPGAGDERDEG